MEQPTFSDVEYEGKKRKTRREMFPERMDGLIPWQQLEERVRPHYPKAGRGRRPYELSVMLRVHCVQLFYNLSDPGMDDLLYEAEQDGLKRYVSSGKGFVCIHIAGCAPSDWTEYHEITGGGWISGTSYHPPYGAMTVKVSDPSHQGAAGVSGFATEDELYMNVVFNEGNDVFITAEAADGTYPWGPDRAPTFMPGGVYPMGWTRSYGEGKVFVLLLGHDGRSFETPEFQQIVLNGVEWATAKTVTAG